MALDHGEINIPLTGKRARSLDAEIAREVANQHANRRAENKTRAQQRRAEREAEKTRTKLTREDIEGARIVRDKYGWHPVVRVNQTTVTYRSFEIESRMTFDKVLEVRK